MRRLRSEKWQIILPPLTPPEPRLWEAVTGNFSRMTIASCLEHPRLSRSEKPVLGSNFFSIPSSQFSFLKNLFDLKIIWLISQVLPLFWILDPLIELGIKTKANTSISTSSFILTKFHSDILFNPSLMMMFKSLFSGVISSVLVWCPGSGCDARLVRAGANFVHI